jgi:SAM-dependent MidA family methyltransferase
MRVQLPEPTADEREHSARVAALIRKEIAAAGGALDFARYMELALYAPGLGYYSAGAAKFGAAGDFVTAPELGAVFARCLAQAIAPAIRATRGDLLEIGPGSGALAAELLAELERLDALPARYLLLERSADLRARQRETLTQRAPQLLARCAWLDVPPDTPWCGALVANEVLDALPVRLFALRDDGVFARAVACDAQGAFVWREVPADAVLREAVGHRLGARAVPRPYCSELCPLLTPWLATVAGGLQRGAAWFIDYGCDRETFYAPQRDQGTLTCHFRHRAHDDPLILPGIQDITAWVDFDALADAARAARFAVGVFQTQAQFLVANGLEAVFVAAQAECGDEGARYRLAQEVKRLMLPGQMGDAFRVMRLDKP